MRDQLNRDIQLKDTPRRIVSLVPSQTELLVDLGLREFIVGVTKFCVHPNDLRKEKAVVGGTKQVNVERINSLQPDIILCNKEENTPEIIESLSDIAPIHISDVNSIEDCYELLIMYGEIFDVEEKASSLIANIEKERSRFQSLISSSKKVAYFIWKEPWMVAASHTFINSMLKEANFQNVFQKEKRYPQIELNNEKLKEVEAIFLSSEPYPFKENHVKELKQLFPEKEIKIVDGELFSWYGSRLLKSFRYFEILHK